MKGIRFILALIIISLLVFPGCKKYRVPKGFPKPDKMAEIVAELHLVESAMNYGNNYSYAPGGNQPGYYRSVLEKYGLTSEQFDTIRRWYVDNPEIYQYVYDRAIVILSKREAEVRIALEREREQERKRQEELRKRPSNLWTGETSMVIYPTATIDKRVPFRYVTDTFLIDGDLRLTAYYKFLKEDESRSPRMMLSAFYADSTADTVYQDVPHSFQKKGAVLNLGLRKDVKPIEIHGFLLLQDSLIKSSVEIDNISLVVVRDSLLNEIPKRALQLEEAIQ